MDAEVTAGGSILIGTEHLHDGKLPKSMEDTIKQIEALELPVDARVLHVFEGEAGEDGKPLKQDINGKKIDTDQGAIGQVIQKKFSKAKSASWDKNLDVTDSSSPIFKHIADTVFSGDIDKANAALWANVAPQAMQQGNKNDFNADDYLNNRTKQWIADQAKKGGAKGFDGKVDWNNLTDQQIEDLFQLNFRDDDSYGETELFRAQEVFNNFRQQELSRTIQDAEKNGYTVIASMGNSHVDLWRQRQK